jgi:surfeit locus 1 family protein
VARIGQQVPYPLLPAYVELEAQQPGVAGPLPRLIPAPDLDDGPHLAYAVQWFIFSTLAVVGWVVVVRREVKTQHRSATRVEPTDDEQAPATPVAPH